MPKPVRLRRLAADDVDDAITHLTTQAGRDIAVRFVDALEVALTRIGRHPHQGTSRFSYELDLPALRAWPLARFPYIVFYLERDKAIDVVRILHTRRDIPATLVEHDR